uniref:Uncharacterized protein n=1 Tax=Anguilla anguilla TaxID=7936 RepID=A0A0E9UUV0_ANGAN
MDFRYFACSLPHLLYYPSERGSDQRPEEYLMTQRNLSRILLLM